MIFVARIMTIMITTERTAASAAAAASRCAVRATTAEAFAAEGPTAATHNPLLEIQYIKLRWGLTTSNLSPPKPSKKLPILKLRQVALGIACAPTRPQRPPRRRTSRHQSHQSQPTTRRLLLQSPSLFSTKSIISWYKHGGSFCKPQVPISICSINPTFLA